LNCVFDNVTRAFRIKTNRGRGGVVEGIQLLNLVARRIRKAGFMITGWHDLGMYTGTTEKVGAPETIPIFRDISIRDIIIGQTPAIGSIEGLPEQAFERFVLHGITASSSATGLEIANVKHLVIEASQLSVSGAAALRFKDSADVELRLLRIGGPPRGKPVIVLESVQDILIADCRVPPTVDRLLDLRGTANRGVVLARNRALAAAIPKSPAITVM
jgi:hypothetical protein